MAADEPVAVLNLGVVAKIDLAEIKRPFIRAGILSGGFFLRSVVVVSFNSGDNQDKCNNNYDS